MNENKKTFKTTKIKMRQTIKETQNNKKQNAQTKLNEKGTFDKRYKEKC